jgi:hypothetical protein
MIRKRESKQIQFAWATGMAVFMLLAFSACNKTEDFEKLDLLTSKNWNLMSIKQDGVIVSDSCDLDDVLYFENASEFSYDNGALNCNNEGSSTMTAKSWKIIEDFTVIRLKYKISGGSARGEMVEYWKIETLNDSMLVVKDNTAESSGLVPEIRTYE